MKKIHIFTNKSQLKGTGKIVNPPVPQTAYQVKEKSVPYIMTTFADQEITFLTSPTTVETNENQLKGTEIVKTPET